MGIHWIGPGSYGELMPIFSELRPPCAVVVNELDKIVSAIKTVSPRTFVMGRIKDRSWPDGIAITGDPAFDYRLGSNRFLAYYPHLIGVPADCFSIDNEWLSQDDPWMLSCGCQAVCGEMDAAAAFKVRLGIGNFNTGQPQLERKEIFDAMRPMLDKADAQGHVLVIHWYPTNGDLVKDYGRLVSRWVPVFSRYPRLRVLIGEYAPDVQGDGGELLMSTGDQVMKKWPQIIGAARFSRGSGWDEYKFDIGVYGHWLATHR